MAFQKFNSIGLDMDGVLVDLESYQLKKGIPYFARLFQTASENLNMETTAYDIEDIFHCTHTQRMTFWKKYIWAYCLTEPAREGAAEITRKWHEEGRSVNIITSRVYVMRKDVVGVLFRAMVRFWLKKNHIYYDEICFCSEENCAVDKTAACRLYSTDLMVEDKIENLEAVRECAVPVCFAASWNQDYVREGIVRVKDFFDVDRFIREQEKAEEAEPFKMLSSKRIKAMSENERDRYYVDLKKYYRAQPFDRGRFLTDERHYLTAGRVIIPCFQGLFHPKVFYRERIPAEKGLIFVCNHLGSLDQFTVIAAVGRKHPLHIVASDTLLKMKRGLLYRYVGCIFVDKKSLKSKMDCLEKLKVVLLHGGSILLFPEGTRNCEEKFMLEFDGGAALLAKETGRPIVPLAITEDYHFGNNHLYCRIGEPVKVSPKDDLKECVDDLRNRVATLVWENMEEERHRNMETVRAAACAEHNKKREKIERQRRKTKSMDAIKK